jgi:transcriptional regulator with XRE-family HTH domain
VISRELQTRHSRTRSGRRQRTSSATTAEAPQLGEALRRRRLQRGLAVADIAAELGVPAKTLRALEWERRDLLGSARDADRIERAYAAYLGEEAGLALTDAAQAPPSASSVSGVRAAWIPVLGGLSLTFVITLVYVLAEVADLGGDGGDDLTSGRLRFLALGLVFVSSLLLLGAVLPPSLVARSPVPPATFARYRQPLALAAIGILAPVTLFALLLAVA